jgi:hypothetical protein
MTEGEYERQRETLGSAEVHMSMCHTSGKLYLRLVDGRFRSLPRRELKARLAETKQILSAMGGVVPLDPTLPVHRRLEFLDNVLDFEMNQPCGCGRARGVAMAEA